jgi:hypothetical protein
MDPFRFKPIKIKPLFLEPPNRLSTFRNSQVIERSRFSGCRLQRRIRGPLSCGYEHFCLMGHNAVYSGESQPMLRGTYRLHLQD